MVSEPLHSVSGLGDSRSIRHSERKSYSNPSLPSTFHPPVKLSQGSSGAGLGSYGHSYLQQHTMDHSSSNNDDMYSDRRDNNGYHQEEDYDMENRHANINYSSSNNNNQREDDQPEGNSYLARHLNPSLLSSPATSSKPYLNGQKDRSSYRYPDGDAYEAHQQLRQQGPPPVPVGQVRKSIPIYYTI